MNQHGNSAPPKPPSGGSEEFLHLLSHDLSAPVRTMVTYLDFFSDDWARYLPPEGQADLAKVHRSARKVRQMLEDLKTYSRAARCRPSLQPTDLRRCIQTAVEQERKSIEAVAGQIVSESAVPQLLADQSILSLIFRELLRNAIRYRSPERPLVVRFTAEQHPDGWMVGVQDNGMGINSLRPDTLFEPLRKGPNAPPEATGIGLACCRRWAECLGATIDAEPNPTGPGAHFIIRFLAEA